LADERRHLLHAVPALSGEFVDDLRIENLVLDGNRENNAELDGNYAGCIFLQDCNRITIRGVTARNYHGDGISWQICHDVVVENCVSENNANLGLHPGSRLAAPDHPQQHAPRKRHRHLLLLGCQIRHRRREHDGGQSHRHLHRPSRHRQPGHRQPRLRQQVNGVLFRPERGPDFAGHRNLIEGNTFIDNAAEGGAVIDIQGGTESITIRNNTFTDSRPGTPRLAVKSGPETKAIVVEANRLQGVQP
jgi:hypothetical protein